MDIDREAKEGKTVVRFGKHFCCEEHAEQFRQKQAQEQKKDSHKHCH